MPKKRLTGPSEADRRLRRVDNFENRRLVQEQVEEFGVEQTAQLAANRAERRRIEITSTMMGDDGTDPGFLHSAMCMVSLPAKKPAADMEAWTRENGRVSLTIAPGIFKAPGRPLERIGVPYGARARLLLMYLQSEAIRTKQPVISMGGSLSEWMRSVGIEHITGGRTGSIGQTYEQTRRLGFAAFSLVWEKPDGTGYGVIPNRTIIEKMDLWKGGNPDQGMLWPSTMELTLQFFESLREHAVPFPREAIVRIKGSALAIDLYIWLVYRLRRLGKPVLVPWDALHGHLGADYGRPQDSKRKAIEALRLALAAYPDARAEPCDGGLLLKPSRSAIPSSTVFSSPKKPAADGAA
jgi:hypothetical protein